jgi:hypothetical protein
MLLRRGIISSGKLGGVTPPSEATYSSYAFDGTGDQVNFGNDSSLQVNSGSFTAWCWFKTSDATAANQIMFGKFNDSLTAGWMFRMTSARNIAFVRTRQGVDEGGVLNTNVTSGSTYNDDNWHLALGVYTLNTGIELFIDNVSVGTSSANNGAAVSETTDVIVGAQDRVASPRYFIGSIASCGLNATALGATDRGYIYNSGKPFVYGVLPSSITTDTKLAPELTSNSGVTDLSGNGNNGTASGDAGPTGDDLTFDLVF